MSDVQYEENEEKPKRKKANIPVYYWEILLKGDDEPMLIGPYTSHEMFYWLQTQGYEIPSKIKRLRPNSE